MTTILLTGATGLVGSRLLPRLTDAGFDCRVLTRRDVALPPETTAVRGDLNQPDSLQEAVAGVDGVVHLAALFRTDDEDAIWRANLDGTRNLIEAARTHAPEARLIMASTGNVYNADASRPSREDDEASPTAAYPASKLAAEALLRDSGRTWVITRLPFVYGDGDGHLESLPGLARRFGLHPANSFSVAHHRDIAAVMRLALSGEMDGRVVNVTDEADATIYEMTQIVGDPLEESSEPLVNPWLGRMDGALARELGFKPTVPTIRAAVREGIL